MTLGIFAVFFVNLVFAEDRSKIGPFIEVSSFSHSEPIAINALFNDWKGSFSSGEKAFSFNRFKVGFHINDWQLAVINRQDYAFEFSPETAQLIYESKNKIPLKPNDNYRLDFKSQSFLARGLQLAYKKTFNEFKIGFSAAYLEGYDLLDGNLSGQAKALATNDYDFNFDVNYAYSEDALFSRKNLDKVNGQGYAFDLAIDWQLNEKWALSARVEDLFAKMHWVDAPRTIANGSSQTKEFDEDGFVLFRPVASGLETNSSFTQSIPTKVFIHSDYAMSERQTLVFQMDDYAIMRFYSLGYSFKASQASHFEATYNLTAKALGLSFQNNWLKASLLSDAWPLKQAKTLGIGLSARYLF